MVLRRRDNGAGSDATGLDFDARAQQWSAGEDTIYVPEDKTKRLYRILWVRLWVKPGEGKMLKEERP